MTPSTLNPVCAIYTRLNRNAKASALIQQRERRRGIIKAWQTAGLGVQIREYADLEASGMTMARPGLQRLLRDSGRKAFQIVLCDEYHRLSRNIQDLSNIMKLLESRRINLIVASAFKL